MTVKPGDILREKFRIDSVIGRGGMGQVFAATDLETRSEVAIKIVSRNLVDDLLIIRLHREAEAAQRIRSDFVPRLYEVSDTEEGETFLVMERLVGEPLSQRIRDNGALPWSEVYRIGEDILHGLIDAHTAGVIHRDLKPSNVFLAHKDSRVRAMVLDFGVCKVDSVDAERLTGTGESIGTVAYMAPEQIRGAAGVDERADLYAFGVLVFEMLTGRLPHDGPSQMAILASKLESSPATLRDCSRVAIPEGTDEVVTRALQRDPSQRFANAQELLKAWRKLAKHDSTLAPGDRSSARDSELCAYDPPTEISRPSLPRPAASSAGPAGGQASLLASEPASPSRRRSAAAEAHPTQTSLTTHHASMDRRASGARLAMLLATLGLVAGIVAAWVSFSRGGSAPLEGASSGSTLSAEPALATSVAPSAAVEISSSTAPAETASGETAFEVPENSVPGGPPRAKRASPRVRPAPSSSPKSSGPTITTQPRY